MSLLSMSQELCKSSDGRQEKLFSNSSEIALSKKLVNSGSFPGEATQCPQGELNVRNSAFGIWHTSISLSSGGKYKSELQAITMVLALVAPRAC